MSNYRNHPRQRGLSDNPIHVSNPRRFARTRCQNMMNNADKLIIYAGEIVETYCPEHKKPGDAIQEVLELSEHLMDQGVDLNAVYEYLSSPGATGHDFGKFGGYILMAAHIMQTAVSLRDIAVDLRSRI